MSEWMYFLAFYSIGQNYFANFFVKLFFCIQRNNYTLMRVITPPKQSTCNKKASKYILATNRIQSIFTIKIKGRRKNPKEETGFLFFHRFYWFLFLKVTNDHCVSPIFNYVTSTSTPLYSDKNITQNRGYLFGHTFTLSISVLILLYLSTSHQWMGRRRK